MRLHSIEINNFRSIKDLTIEFNNECKILIGINESGKSNILKAMSFLGDFIPLVGDVRIPLPDEEPNQESIIDFVFEMETSDVERVINNVSAKFIDNEIEKIILYDIKTKEEFILSHFLLDNPVKGLFRINVKNRTKDIIYYRIPNLTIKGWKAINHTMNIEANVMINNKSINLKQYDFISLNDSRNISPQFLLDVAPEQISKLIGKEIMDIVSKNFPKCIFWHYDERNILPTEIKLKDFAENPDFCIPLKNMFNLYGKENIFDELRENQNNRQVLMSLLKNVAKKTTALFQETWKEYVKVEFDLQPDGENILVLIKEHNYFSLAQRSDGFKRFVSFLLLISASVEKENIKNTLLLIDEPDIGLHPHGAKLLKEELLKIAKTNLVVYSTHSMFMIDKENLERNLICSKENETTKITVASSLSQIEEQLA